MSDSRSKCLQQIEDGEGKEPNFQVAVIGVSSANQQRSRNHRFKPVPHASMLLPSILNDVKLPVA